MMMVVSSTGGLLVVFLLLVLSSSEAALCSTVNCTEAECKPLLNSYLNECATAFVAGGNCSQACKDAYDQLLESDYFGCSCDNDSLCSQSAQHFLTNCFNGVRPSPPPVNVTEDCNVNTVTSACNQNPICGPLLVAYLHECRFAFQGINCSQHCKQAFVALLQDPVGNRFTVCHCATQDTACQSKSQNLSTTCFNGTFPGAQPQEPTPAQMAAFPKDNAAYLKGNVHIVLMSATMGFSLLVAQ